MSMTPAKSEKEEHCFKLEKDGIELKVMYSGAIRFQRGCHVIVVPLDDIFAALAARDGGMP